MAIGPASRLHLEPNPIGADFHQIVEYQGKFGGKLEKSDQNRVGIELILPASLLARNLPDYSYIHNYTSTLI